MISLEELKRLHKEATQGPWQTTEDNEIETVAREYKDPELNGIPLQNIVTTDGGYYPPNPEDADLIVYLRNHCEDIIKILEERE